MLEFGKFFVTRMHGYIQPFKNKIFLAFSDLRNKKDELAIFSEIRKPNEIAVFRDFIVETSELVL